jgi:hypothetical protein
MKRLVISLILCLLPLYLPAAVSVTGVTGTLTHGSSVTISGSGFGTKTTAAPVSWETWETGGSNLTAVDNIHGWLGYHENGTTPSVPYISHFSSVDNHSTGGSMCCRLLHNQPPGNMMQTFWRNDINSDEMYITFWYKLIIGGLDTQMPIKFIRANTSTTDPYHTPADGSTCEWMEKESTSGILQYWVAVQSVGGVESQGSSTTALQANESRDNPPELRFKLDHGPVDGEPTSGQAWRRVEVYAKMNSSGNADGIVKYTWNGTTIFNHTDIVYRAVGQTQKWQCIMFPSMPGNELTYQWDIRADDIYCDGTQARVEIGDASTWSACTHKEVQPATSWSDSSATVTLNRGSFGATDPAYVYVVDSNGAVNTNGRSITFGGSGSGAVPSLCGGKFNKN